MIYFKSCLRCEGDVYHEVDAWGAFMRCLQYGKIWDSHQRAARRSAEPEAVEYDWTEKQAS